MVEAARSPPDNHANAERISPPRSHQRAQIPYQKRRDEHKKCPAPEDPRGAASGSVAGVRDDGDGTVIVLAGEIGSAVGRDRVSPYVSTTVVAASLTQTTYIPTPIT